MTRDMSEFNERIAGLSAEKRALLERHLLNRGRFSSSAKLEIRRRGTTDPCGIGKPCLAGIIRNHGHTIYKRQKKSCAVDGYIDYRRDTYIMQRFRGSSSSDAVPAPDADVSYTVNGLSSGTTYYWQITADDGKGGTSNSAARSFTTR